MRGMDGMGQEDIEERILEAMRLNGEGGWRSLSKLYLDWLQTFLMKRELQLFSLLLTFEGLEDLKNR